MKTDPSNEKEFRTIYETYYNRLCAVAYRILREQDAARDIIQEVFIDIWNKGNWSQIQSPKAYLYVAVYNRALKAFKSRKLFLSEEAIPQYSQEDEKLEEKELEKIIAKGIDNLPDRCKIIFLLSREEEMTYAQIAKHLALSEKTVENQMGIALKKLRDYLGTHWS